MKHYWKALFVLLLSAFFYRILTYFIPGNWSWFLEIAKIFSLLFVGYSLLPKSKKNTRWLGKTLISLFVLFLMFYRLGLVGWPEFGSVLAFMGLEGVFMDLLFVYFGWAFFQV